MTGRPLMASITLRTATGTQGATRALMDGTVTPRRFTLEFAEIADQAGLVQAFRRMVRCLEFDICEMAFTTYLCAKDQGKPITAIPVFLTRNFHHWAMFHNRKAGITNPKDLEGRKVAVNRGYTVTTGLWARGILEHEYGV